MPEKSITILHVSDLQFDANHRFCLDTGTPDAKHDTLLGRLTQDLDSLRKDYHLRPDLAVFTGDLTEWGKKTEFEDLRGFVEGLCKHLELPHNRIIMIPGNHDINRVLCENYFRSCEENGEKPANYYWPKWEFYKKFFDAFYRDLPNIQFTQEQPYTLFEIPELQCVVAGLNSAMKESHKDHCGFVGEEQLRQFQKQLKKSSNSAILKPK